MAATELNFGPEWLRALSDGVGNKATNTNQQASNNSSSCMGNMGTGGGNMKTNSKMVHQSKSCSSSSSCSTSSLSVTNKHNTNNCDIKYRYSKEEMLSYFNRSLNCPPPKDLMQHEEVFVEDVQNPLAFIELTADEINLLSQSINSDFVLKKSSNSTEQNPGTGSTDSIGGNVSGNSIQNTSTNNYKEPMLNRMKLSNMNSNNSNNSPSSSSDLLLGSHRTGGSSGERSNKHGTNGFVSERASNYGLRASGRGASIATTERSTPTRSALRSTNNIVFTRLSSLDNDNSSTGTSGPAKTNSTVFIAKKGSGLQRSSTSDSTNANNGIGSNSSNTWRSGSFGSSTSSGPNTHNNTTTSKETTWKTPSNSNNSNNNSSSVETKNWRNDMANNNNSNSGTGSPSYSSSNSSSISSSKIVQYGSIRLKDIFNSNDGKPGSDDEMIRGTSKMHNNTSGTSASPIDNVKFNNNKNSKPFNRRFTSGSSSANESNDLFKSDSYGHHRSDHHSTSSHHHHSFNEQLDAERDLFGGRPSANNSTNNNSSSTGTSSNYNDLFSRNSSNNSNKTLATLNSYSSNRGDHRGDSSNNSSSSSNFGQDNSSKFNNSTNHYSGKSYDRSNSNLSSYHQRSHQYERFSRSGGGGGHSGSINQNDDSDFFTDRFSGRGGTGNLTSEDDDYRRNSLPEWSLEDPSTMDVTRVGTFDASGAFHEVLYDDEDDGNEFFKDDDQNESTTATSNQKSVSQTNKDTNDNQDKNNDQSNEKNEQKKDKISIIDHDLIRKVLGSGTKPDSFGKQHSNLEHDNKQLLTELALSHHHQKTATIDYFNDPSLSPNYSSREESNKNQFNNSSSTGPSVDHGRKENNDIDMMNVNSTADRSSKDAISSNNNRDQVNEPLMMLKKQQTYQSSSIDDEQSSTSATGEVNGISSSDFNHLSAFSLMSAVNSTTISQQQRHESNTANSLLTESSVSFKPQSSQNSFNSLLNGQNSVTNTSNDNHGDGATTINHLLNDDVTKLSSLLNDFNFDFGTNTSGNQTGHMANADQLFHVLTSTQSSVNMNHNFINNNAAIGPNAASASVVGPTSSSFANSTAFENNALLNLVNTSSSGQQQQTFAPSARYSNLMSSGGAAPIPSVGSMLKPKVEVNRPDETILNTKWFYCDPQGETQGPFTSQEMYEWFNLGYFTSQLLVKRATDSKFTKLGELIQSCGSRCPFIVPPNQMLHNNQVPSSTQPTTQSSSAAANFPQIKNDGTLFSNFNGSNNGPQKPPPQQQHPHTAPILHSQSILNHHQQQQPFIGPQASSAGPIVPGPPFQTSNVNSFGLDEPMFNYFQNIKKQEHSIGLGPRSGQTDDLLAANDSNLMELIQQQQRQLHGPPGPQPPQPPPQQSSNGPTMAAHLTPNPSSIHHSQEKQIQMFLNHLNQLTPTGQMSIKDELMAMNSQQREQYIMDKFPQFSMNYNKEQQLRQYQMAAAAAANNGGGGHPPINSEMPIFPIDEDQINTANSSAAPQTQRTPKKLSLDETSTANVPQQMQMTGQMPPQLQRAHSYEPAATNAVVASGGHFMAGAGGGHPSHQQIKNTFQTTANVQQAPPAQSVPAQIPDQNKSEDPFHLLKKYANNNDNNNNNNNNNNSNATSTGPSNNSAPTWIGDNFVAGALSVTDVEELQRREAEERYRNQQQQQQLQQHKQQMEDMSDYMDNDNGEFIEVDRKQKNLKQQQLKMQQQQQKKNFQTKDQTATGQMPSPNKTAPNAVQQQPTERNNSVASNSGQTSVPPQNIISQMSQLPKNSVWANQTCNSGDNMDQQQSNNQQPLSIAEIQRLQEQKEDEERRQRDMQQQMNASMLQQQRSMKWASQPWQEQNTSHVKTLAEIQAEEAEKQAKLMRQQLQQEASQEAQARQKRQALLSVIVSKGQQQATGVWNNNKTSTGWDDHDEQHGTMSSVPQSSINYKNAVQANAAGSVKPSVRVDCVSLKQLLKTNPKVIKKVEDTQLMKINVENYDDLLKCSVEILNKHFDSVDAIGFMSIVKDLGSPNEVSEYCHSYLGNNPVSLFFSKFFISKKSYLFKLKQEQERNKQKLKNSWNNNSSSSNNEEDEQGSQRTINYKSALNSNAHQQQQINKSTTASNNNKIETNRSSSNVITSGHIKSTTVKPLTNKSKPNDDVNLMTIQVETMDEFDKWCLNVLKINFELDIDAETFISFLKDIASPDEINDYVQTYLGSSKASRDFTKNFISKRSYLRNKAKQKEPYEDMCGPAPALTPMLASNNNDNNGFVTVTSSNKKRRTKNKNQNHQND